MRMCWLVSSILLVPTQSNPIRNLARRRFERYMNHTTASSSCIVGTGLAPSSSHCPHPHSLAPSSPVAPSLSLPINTASRLPLGLCTHLPALYNGSGSKFLPSSFPFLCISGVQRATPFAGVRGRASGGCKSGSPQNPLSPRRRRWRGERSAEDEVLCRGSGPRIRGMQ